MFPAEPTSLLVAGLLAFVAVWAAMPLAVRAWTAVGCRDDEVSLRKVHVQETPRVGGMVVMLGFAAVVLMGLAGVGELSRTHELFSVSPLSGALWGALMVGLTGLWDDLAGLRPRTKLCLQGVAALVAVLHGVHWPALESWLGPGWEWVASIFTVVFLLAAVNAVNLLDGLDGLAGGVLAIALSVVLGGVLLAGNSAAELAIGWTAAAAVGAYGGFLIHNRHPARVFMGDGGAYFGGFLAAALLLGIHPVRWRIAPIQFCIPVMVLMLPLFDTSMAVVRRLVRGQPLFAGDGDHVHHRLLTAGLSHVQAVRVLWGVSAMFGALAMATVLGVGGWWTLLGTLLAVLIAAVLLGYHRLLQRLPAFSGESSVGWTEHRRRTKTALCALGRLRTQLDAEGPKRWERGLGPLAEILAASGIPRVEVWRGDERVVAAGPRANTWATLAIPIPGTTDAEVRFGLMVRLPGLGPQHHALLEAAVGVLAVGEQPRPVAEPDNVVPLTRARGRRVA